MSVLNRNQSLARDYATSVAASAVSFRERCRLAPLVAEVSHELGTQLVIEKRSSDQFGLSVYVFADVNDDGAVSVTLVAESGETLQELRLRRVSRDVAMTVVATLVNDAQKSVSV